MRVAKMVVVGGAAQRFDALVVGRAIGGAVAAGGGAQHAADPLSGTAGEVGEERHACENDA